MKTFIHEMTKPSDRKLVILTTNRDEKRVASVISRTKEVPCEICEGQAVLCPTNKMTPGEREECIAAVSAVTVASNPGTKEVHVHVVTCQDGEKEGEIAIMGYPLECEFSKR